MSESDNDAPRIAPSPGLHVVRAGGAVIGETASGWSVLMPGDETPTMYLPKAEAGALFLEPAETTFEIPGLGRARQYDLIAKSGPIRSAAWAIEAPATGAEMLIDHVAFDPERVAVERL
ncbi:MAG TPA: DUF427 domain-containing protein [Paracoccaceae bacterium]|nr:DUF427 domain-containing protein [Paracoccaceae bacterium]